MDQQQQYELQILIVSGPEAVDRAVLGFAFAVSAATSGIKVMVFLTLQGIAWAEQNIPAAKQKVNGFSSIEDYINILKDNDAVIRLCSSCVKNNCAIDKVELENTDTCSYIGLTEVAIRAACNTINTIVF